MCLMGGVWWVCVFYVVLDTQRTPDSTTYHRSTYQLIHIDMLLSRCLLLFEVVEQPALARARALLVAGTRTYHVVRTRLLLLLADDRRDVHGVLHLHLRGKVRGRRLLREQLCEVKPLEVRVPLKLLEPAGRPVRRWAGRAHAQAGRGVALEQPREEADRVGGRLQREAQFAVLHASGRRVRVGCC